MEGAVPLQLLTCTSVHVYNLLTQPTLGSPATGAGVVTLSQGIPGRHQQPLCSALVVGPRPEPQAEKATSQSRPATSAQ